MFYTAAYLQQRKDCKGWRGFLDYKDADGKRRKKSKTMSATGKRAASAELEEWRAQMEAEHERELKEGPKVPPVSSIPVSQYVDDMVTSLANSKAIEASTVSGYRTTAGYIREAFSNVTMGELTPEQVRDWEAGLIGRGLSSSTVGKAHRLLKQAFKYAVNSRALTWNPVDAVKPPKRTKKHTGINALDKAGRTLILSKLDGMGLTPVTVAARIALFTGLREAEICGLQWRDVDPSSSVLWVRRSIGTGEGGTYLKLAKTDKARDVALPKSLAALLVSWRERQTERFRAIGAILGEDSYIIGDPVGYYRPGRLSKDWTALSRALEVRGTEGRLVTFHDLRHTWATMYLAAGGDVKTAASNLGHANAAMTLNIYASADPDAKRRAAVIVEENMRDSSLDVLSFTGTNGPE
ncbi:hypothetical protein B5F79_08630 [Olsenella sp. An285]|uniref:tyrosine-type recombinase/integrase n=1 Tax=Olsenella sp. An285 TaxID=1965621 RepID=UPI000B381A82|nr:tyrosine-type recombinase/integrase [Olsenella sp. An285]OUO46002.1 hypothetical protein B5F79_08630 [Olsenella sp. An285]